MRQSYRDKNSRKARINREKEENKFKKNNVKKVHNANTQNREQFVEPKEEKVYEDVIYGRNSVLELLKSGKDINKIFVERGEKHRFN